MKKAALESPFDKVAGLKPCNFLEKKLQHRCFPANIAKSKNIFFYRIPLVDTSRKCASVYFPKYLQYKSAKQYIPSNCSLWIQVSKYFFTRLLSWNH